MSHYFPLVNKERARRRQLLSPRPAHHEISFPLPAFGTGTPERKRRQRPFSTLRWAARTRLPRLILIRGNGVWVAWRSSTRGMHQVAGGFSIAVQRSSRTHRRQVYAKLKGG